MDPQRQSTPEAGAYRMLHDVVTELEQAAQRPGRRPGAAPDTERRRHLEAIRAAIATLRTVNQGRSASGCTRTLSSAGVSRVSCTSGIRLSAPKMAGVQQSVHHPARPSPLARFLSHPLQLFAV